MLFADERTNTKYFVKRKKEIITIVMFAFLIQGLKNKCVAF